MALIVQKYGGSSVGDIERIRKVAQRVIEAKKEGNQVVVIVSAMAGETDRLIGLAHQITEMPSEREFDVLVSTGEQVAIALIAMALESQGYPARSFLGAQIRITTDGVFTKARILGVEAERILEELEKGTIAVIAGFQGIDEEGNITTLGRGGSDTTAVAIAAALKANACEIYTDVEGVYTTDPAICPEARKLSRVSYEEMLEMASLGAKVLQSRSVEFAMKHRVPIHVRSSFSQEEGTWVLKEDEKMEEVLVSGITCDKKEAKVTISKVPDKPGIASKIFGAVSEANVVVDMIIQNVSAEGYTDVTFTIPQTDLKKALEVVRRVSQEIDAGGVESDSNIAKVSVVGVGMRSHSGVAARAFSALGKEGINIMMISTSEIKLSCVIEAKYAELAVRVLHEAFELEKTKR
ncbi:MAG: aspartate kinase [Deltaproteobacteria bacterium]|nr:MAG: aspartate kinase [Deltaproteobacteria bacterium]